MLGTGFADSREMSRVDVLLPYVTLPAEERSVTGGAVECRGGE